VKEESKEKPLTFEDVPDLNMSRSSLRLASSSMQVSTSASKLQPSPTGQDLFMMKELLHSKTKVELKGSE